MLEEEDSFSLELRQAIFESNPLALRPCADGNRVVCLPRNYSRFKDG